MAHNHLRKTKTCLNCGTIVPERYCSHCGQENSEPKESFKHLVGHFLEDVTHYDSKFFTTIRDLVFKPGFLTKEYNAGKRVAYLNPIRMYIFISAVFFLLVFSQKKEESNAATTNIKHNINLFSQHLADSLKSAVKKGHKLSSADSATNKIYTSLSHHLDTVKKSELVVESLVANISSVGIIKFHFTNNRYSSLKQYDSVQKSLPAKSRENFIGRYVSQKTIRIKNENGNSPDIVIDQNIEHTLPKIMFVLLPLFALIIRFFYKRKKYTYPQNAIFSLHFHSFVFLTFLVVCIISLFGPSETFLMVFAMLAMVGIFIYLVAALHNVYQQAVWLSIIKALLISFLYAITLMLCSMFVMMMSFILL